MSSNTAEFVGSIPQHYDRNLGPYIFADYAADLARRVAAGKPARVLETAAGTGILTRSLREALPDSTEITATDLFPPMLEVARGKFSSLEQVSFQPADATTLPFADGSFDALACQFGVMFFPDKDKSYREAWRVLAPGGHYVFNVWDSHEHNAFGRLAHETVGRFFPVDPPQFQKMPFAYPFAQAKESLAQAGFTDIAADLVRIEKSLPDPEPLARGLVYGSPIIDQVHSRGGIEPEAIVEAMADTFRKEFRSGRMPLQAMVFSATRA